jgi:accessory gene regulator B
VVENLSSQITSFICTENYNNPKDRAKIQYAVNVLLSEGLKTMFLMLFFGIIGHASYFYFSLLIMMTIRIFAGGVHIKGTFNCLLITTVIFLVTSVVSPLIPLLPIKYYLCISIISLLILIIRAPICSVRRPIKDNKKKLQYKIIAVSITVAWSVALLYLSNSHYINCGFATILIQNIQLVIAKKNIL